MTIHLTTSPNSLFWRSPESSSASARGAHYVGGMVSFAFSLPIRAAVLAYRVLKTVVAILYAVFGTLSQDRAKNWGECKKELIRLGGSVAELLSGCFGVIAPPLAYRMELKLYENEAIREGAIFTQRECKGIKTKSLRPLRPTPEQTPEILPDDHKPYVRPASKVVVPRPTPAPAARDLDQHMEDISRLCRLLEERLEDEQNGADFRRRLVVYIGTRIADETENPVLKTVLEAWQSLLAWDDAIVPDGPNPLPDALRQVVQRLGGGHEEMLQLFQDLVEQDEAAAQPQNVPAGQRLGGQPPQQAVQEVLREPVPGRNGGWIWQALQGFLGNENEAAPPPNLPGNRAADANQVDLD